MTQNNNLNYFHIINLGCKVNLFEANAVSNDLINYGLKITDDINQADVVVVNTCSVTNNADSKSKNMINKSINASKKPIVIVMGCFSQVNKKWFNSKANIIIGNKYKNNVVGLLKQFLLDKNQINKIENIFEVNEFENLKNDIFLENTRAFLKIQDGCNFYCNYCIIPFARGKQRSKKQDEIITDIKSLVSKGYKEIILVGVNTSGYNDNGFKFYDLLKSIDSIEGSFRVRISSLEPFLINKKIIDLIANNSKRWCKHFHLCLQSASNKVLKEMNRHYTIEQFIELVNYIKYKIPDCAITTDYIVGYPSEGDADWSECLKNLKIIQFSDVHIFPFSARKNTVASLIKPIVSSKQIKQRLTEIADLKKQMQEKYLKNFLNKNVEILVETQDDNENKQGHSSQFFVVKFKSKNKLWNKIVNVKVDKIIDNIVYGTALGEKHEK